MLSLRRSSLIVLLKFSSDRLEAKNDQTPDPPVSGVEFPDDGSIYLGLADLWVLFFDNLGSCEDRIRGLSPLSSGSGKGPERPGNQPCLNAGGRVPLGVPGLRAIRSPIPARSTPLPINW